MSQTITKRLQGDTKMGRMYMSANELDRLLIMEKVCKKEIKLNKAVAISKSHKPKVPRVD